MQDKKRLLGEDPMFSALVVVLAALVGQDTNAAELDI